MVSQNIRYDTEVRQIGGIMMALSMSIAVYPLLDATSRISLDIQDNPLYNGDSDNAALNWALLTGDIFVVILGLLGMAIGFMALTDGGIVFVTVIGLIWEQTAFVDWIAKMYALSEYAYKDIRNNPSSDIQYMDIHNNPSSDIQFSFSMQILRMIFLGVLRFGSLGLALFVLYSFQAGKGHLKNASYYRKRLVFYSFMYCAHGIFPYLVQGTKIYLDFKKVLPVKAPPVNVVRYSITHPEITMGIGAIFTLVGIYGMARGLGLAPNDNRYFQLAVFAAYVAYLAAIVLTEFSIAGQSHMATTAGVDLLNGHIILSFLDQKAKTVPEQMDEDYYHDDAIVTKTLGNERAPLSENDEEEVEAEGMA